MDLTPTVAAALAAAGVADVAPLLIGLSGGVDSMVLLDCCRRLDRRLVAWHLDHGLRPASGAEADRLATWAERAGVELLCARVAIAERARRHGQGLEEAGRAERYAGLQRLGEELGATVLLAHHRDDQVETVLANILRGAGPVGLAGMPARRNLGATALVRPLLGVDRQTVLAHARHHGLWWIEDPSNRDRRFRRNRLRHEVIPCFEAGVPGFGAALAEAATRQAERLAEQSLRLAPWFATQYQDGQLGLAGLDAFDDEDRAAIWRRLLVETGLPVRRRFILGLEDLYRGAVGRRLGCGRGHWWRCAGFLLYDRAADPAVVTQPLLGPGPWSLAEGELAVEHFDTPTDGLAAARSTAADPWCELIDVDHLQGPLCWRRLRPGERWRPLGAPGSKPVRVWLRERGVPAPERDRLGVLADAAGVVWVPGLGLAHRLRLRSTSVSVSRLQLRLEASASTPGLALAR